MKLAGPMAAAVASMVLLAGGCDTTPHAKGYVMPSKPLPRPEPRTTRIQRIDQPVRVAVIVSSTARDTNADGFGDRVDVSALLFGPGSPDPVFAEGEFLFELVPVGADGANGSPVGAWVFDAQRVRQAEGPTMFGLPGYRFELDLGEAASSLQPGAVNLVMAFKPASGGQLIVPTQDQRLVRIGPVG